MTESEKMIALDVEAPNTIENRKAKVCIMEGIQPKEQFLYT